METEFKIILKKNSEVVPMMDWDEIDEERADLIVAKRLAEKMSKHTQTKKYGMFKMKKNLSWTRTTVGNKP